MKKFLIDYLRRTLANRGLELLKQPTLQTFIATQNITCVLDVGANVGQFGSLLRRNGFVGRIASYEPSVPSFIKLQAAARGDSEWLVFNYGLGRKQTRLKMNIAENSVFNSVLQSNELAVAFDNSSRVVSTEEVEIFTIDDVFPEVTGGRTTLLKIDTQGFERAVLEGSEASLKSVRGVQLELPTINIYETDFLFSDGLYFMQNVGFKLAQVRLVSVPPFDRSVGMEFDCLFVRG